MKFNIRKLQSTYLYVQKSSILDFFETLNLMMKAKMMLTKALLAKESIKA